MGGNDWNPMDSSLSGIFHGATDDITNPFGVRNLGDLATKGDPTSYMGLGGWGASQTIQNGVDAAGNALSGAFHNTADILGKAAGGDWDKNNPLANNQSMTFRQAADSKVNNDNAQSAQRAQQQVDADTATATATAATNKQTGINNNFESQNDLEQNLLNAKKQKTGQQIYGGM